MRQTLACQTRFADLVAIHYNGAGVYTFRCKRVKPDGTVCNNERELHQKIARKYKCCEECGRTARGHGKGGKQRALKMNLTPEQKVRYRQILNGRGGAAARTEALEILKIETANRGACCKVHRERDWKVAA